MKKIKLRTDVYPNLIRPMLAFPFDLSKFDPMGMVIQPKLDGIRALYQNGSFVSRDGKLWNKGILAHLELEMAALNLPPGLITDGELYYHGMKLQDINARVAVNRTQPHKDVERIEYHVFDCVSPIGILDRYARHLRNMFSQTGFALKLVPSHVVMTPEDADKLYSKYRSMGYEGIMYRQMTDGYSLPWHCTRKDNRSWSLMKRKGGFDLSGCKIVLVANGQGKYTQTTGYLTLTHPDVRNSFDVGSGLSDLERDLLWRNRLRSNLATVDIKFDEYSISGQPLRLRVTALHFDTELANELV